MHSSLKITVVSSLFVAASLAACNLQIGDGKSGSASQAAESGCVDGVCPAACDPSVGDTNCPPPPCDPSNTACPPCDPNDPSCWGGSCAAQEAKGSGPCDSVLGYAWQGCACVPIVGCACEGACCAELAPSYEKCELAHANCDCAPPADDCTLIASALDALLAEAQSCNPASMAPLAECDTLLPTIAHCSVPAHGASPAVAGYLELFAKYASSCPLPDKPCPDVSKLARACAEEADGTGGVCVFVNDASTPAQ